MPQHWPTLLVTLALAGCTSVRWSEVQDAYAGKLVDVRHTRGIVVANGWEPSLDDIRHFEKGVVTWFGILDSRERYVDCDGEFRLAKEHERYFRQYRASVTPAGHRWMTVTFLDEHCGGLPRPRPEAGPRAVEPAWKTGKPVSMSDGGMCQFEVEWDVDADRFVALNVLGGGCA